MTEEARNAGPELKVPYFSDLQATFQRASERQKVRVPVRRQALLILFLGSYSLMFGPLIKKVHRSGSSSLILSIISFLSINLSSHSRS